MKCPYAVHEEGKTYYVPDTMKYMEWENKYVRTDKNSILKISSIVVK